MAVKMSRAGSGRKFNKPKSFNYFYLLTLNFGFLAIICLLRTPPCEALNLGSRSRLLFAGSGLRTSPVTNPDPNPLPSLNYEVPSFATYLYQNRQANARRNQANGLPAIANDVYAIGDIQAMTDDVLAKYPKLYDNLEGINPNADDNEEDDEATKQQKIINTCQTVCACKWKGGKQTVECIDNQLIQIPNNIDPSTQVLDMSGNKLQTLGNEQFRKVNLLNLQKLYLRNCRIGEIEPETFKGLTNLVELDLSHNLLVVVPSFAFGYVPFLRDLTLASNHIHKVEMNAFSNMPALNKLDLSHCDLQFIAPHSFAGIPALNSLRLNGNKLSELLPRTVDVLENLHVIELHDNPWICDCRMRDTKAWLVRKNIPIPVSPVCTGGPTRNVEKSIEQLQVDDFACKPEMLPVSHYVESYVSENASIACRVKAVPRAVINWYWSGRLVHNNTVISATQKVFIFEDGKFERRSRLIITNAQEGDSGEFSCVAENRAGVSDYKVNLSVVMRPTGLAALTTGQLITIGVVFLIVIIIVLICVVYLVIRSKRQTYSERKDPTHLEVVTTVNNSNAILDKAQPPSMQGSIVIANGAVPNCIDGTDNFERSNSIKVINEAPFANPVQKPPRLTDLPYAGHSNNANGFENPTCVVAVAPSYLSPTSSAGNNPDLINDTKRYDSDEFVDMKVAQVLTTAVELEKAAHSGEYNRNGCDSLYPSGLWEQGAVGGTSAADELFGKRYLDSTPMMENTQLFDLHERSDYFSKTFPRSHYSNLPASSGSGIMGNLPSTSSAAMMHQGGTATTNLSTGIVSGYPNDYGLPLVPGAEHQHNHHLQMHPLQQYQHQFNKAQQQYGSANNSPNFNTRTLPRYSDNAPAVPSRSSPLANSRPAHKFVNVMPSTSAAAMAANGMNPLASPSASSASILSNGQPVNAKTIRVWQKGGVPVLPPVSALKRALASTSRGSPDEGYHDGCGTDV